MNLRDAIERLSNNHGSNDERRQEAVALVYACLEQVSRLLEFEIAVRTSPVWDWVEGGKTVSRPSGSEQTAGVPSPVQSAQGTSEAPGPSAASGGRCLQCGGSGNLGSIPPTQTLAGTIGSCPACHGTGAAPAQTKLPADAPDAAEAACSAIRTVADEAFGPFPVQTTEEAITAIERGVFEMRTALERVRALAREWLYESGYSVRGRELLAAIDGNPAKSGG